jgi:hypothetical protein
MDRRKPFSESSGLAVATITGVEFPDASEGRSSMATTRFLVPKGWADVADGSGASDEIEMRGAADVLQVAVDTYGQFSETVGIVVAASAVPQVVRNLVSRAREARSGDGGSDAAKISLVKTQNGEEHPIEVELGASDEDLQRAVETILRALGIPPE